MSKELNIHAIKTIGTTIEHLKTLQQKQFFFGNWITRKHESICKTVCCVGGWYHVWYPEHFKYDSYFNAIETVNSGQFLSFIVLADFHNIGDSLSNHLFMPGHQYMKLFGGRRLGEYSGLKTVIKNWEIVLEKLKSGELNGFES